LGVGGGGGGGGGEVVTFFIPRTLYSNTINWSTAGLPVTKLTFAASHSA